MNIRSAAIPEGTAFTLLEILLAIAVFAVVLVAINTVFYSAFLLRNKTHRLLDQSVPVERTLQWMRQDLQNAVPPGGTLSGSFRSVSSGNLTDGGTGLEFCTTTGMLSDDQPWGEIQKITYQLLPSTNRASSRRDLELVRTVTRNLLPTTREDATNQFLIGPVEMLEFAFYNGSSWVPQWGSGSTDTGMPKAVRVRLQMADTNQATRQRQQMSPLEMVVPLTIQSRTNAPAQTNAAPQ